jgi:hypothetical protein
MFTTVLPIVDITINILILNGFDEYIKIHQSHWEIFTHYLRINLVSVGSGSALQNHDTALHTDMVTTYTEIFSNSIPILHVDEKTKGIKY